MHRRKPSLFFSNPVRTTGLAPVPAAAVHMFAPPIKRLQHTR
ncbi:hypothetical protein [Azospirillum largimobile]